MRHKLLDAFLPMSWFREHGVPGEATVEAIIISQSAINDAGYTQTVYSHQVLARGTNPVTGQPQTFEGSGPYKLVGWLTPGDRLIISVHPERPTTAYKMDFDLTVASSALQQRRKSMEIADLIGTWRFTSSNGSAPATGTIIFDRSDTFLVRARRAIASVPKGSLPPEHAGKVAVQFDKKKTVTYFLSTILGGNRYKGIWVMNQDCTAISLKYVNTNGKIPGSGVIAAMWVNLWMWWGWEILLKRDTNYIVLTAPGSQTMLKRI